MLLYSMLSELYGHMPLGLRDVQYVWESGCRRGGKSNWLACDASILYTLCVRL